jgi:hypothetical protein
MLERVPGTRGGPKMVPPEIVRPRGGDLNGGKGGAVSASSMFRKSAIPRFVPRGTPSLSP